MGALREGSEESFLGKFFKTKIVIEEKQRFKQPTLTSLRSSALNVREGLCGFNTASGRPPLAPPKGENGDCAAVLRESEKRRWGEWEKN